MNKKIVLSVLLMTTLLTGCAESPSSISDQSSVLDPSVSHPSEGGSSSVSSESSKESESSSELLPLVDPDIPGLTRSETWPSDALAAFLNYDNEIEMPSFIGEGDFHHGLYNEELFYRVVLRVRTYNEFLTYFQALEDDYIFTFTQIGQNLFAGESIYDEVRLYLEYSDKNGLKEVIFDFYDGMGDNYHGLEAEGGKGIINLETKEAIISKSKSKVVWKVRPASLTVHKHESSFNVGNDNYKELTNPLRFYAGQLAIFAVDAMYYITSIKIRAASGYANETVEGGTFTNASATYNVDYVDITPLGKVSTIEYTRPTIMYVGHVRWLSVEINFARN